MDICDLYIDSRYATHGLKVAYLLLSKVLVDDGGYEGGVYIQGQERSEWTRTRHEWEMSGQTFYHLFIIDALGME